MTNIYVVMHSSGIYSDREVNCLAAYENEESAKNHIIAATALNKTIEYLYDAKEYNEIEKFIKSINCAKFGLLNDMGDNKYYYETINLINNE